MCGLFGMAGAGIQSKDLDILDELMLISSTRGIDGTGLYAGRNMKGKGFKKAGDPFYWKYLIKNHNDEKDLYNIGNNWFVGHTRGASVGSINDRSAQPFNLKNIVGTHNGTIPGDYSPFATDSERLLSIIDINGPEKLQEVIDSVDPRGSYALVWFDKRSKRLHFLRRKRTLYVAKNHKRSVIYWASEKRFLEFALNNEEHTIWVFEENVHHQLSLSDIKSGPKLAFQQEEITPPLPKVVDKPVPTTEDNVIPLIGSDGTIFDARTGQVLGATDQELQEIPWIRDTQQQQQRRKLN